MVVPAGNSTQIRCFLVYNAQLPQAVDANKTKVEVQKLVFLVTSVLGVTREFFDGPGQSFLTRFQWSDHGSHVNSFQNIFLLS
jgi:hypothetical protein